MKHGVVPSSCRICLRKSKNLRSIYKPLKESEEPPNEMLKLITGIKLEEIDCQADKLPKSICKCCESSLNLAIKFRQKALKSQNIIAVLFKHHYLKNSNDDSLDLDSDPLLTAQTEIAARQLEETTALLDDEQMYAFSNNEIKIEPLEIPFPVDSNVEPIPKKLNDNHLKAIAISSLKTYSVKHIKDESSVTCATITEGSKESTKDAANSLKKSLLKTSVHKSLGKNFQIIGRKGKQGYGKFCKKSDASDLKKQFISTEKCEAVQVQTNKSKYKLLTNKIGRPKGKDESGYICDICGNIYARRGSLMDHRRRHDKELQFECELCGKKFQLREKLRRHMFTHSGGKPYKCSLCSRSFFYESVKKAHEAVHKGIKPYICDVCKKPFAYSHALKRHKLIHAKIKLYHCEYCDKDFRLQHHMKQHEETKAHQTAVASV